MEEPSKEVPAASPTALAGPSNYSTEPGAVDELVPMEDEAPRQHRRVRLPRVAERFHIPAVVPDGDAARAHLIRVFREDIIQGQM
jgi:hypothetical protein